MTPVDSALPDDAAVSCTVVSVTFHPGPALTSFLSSLAQAGAVAEIVLADNDEKGCLDPDLAAVAERGDARVITSGANIGYGAAVNLAVATISSDFVLICNPDVIFDPDAVTELLAATARWPGAGSYGPLIRTAEGQVYPSARALPSLVRGIGHAVCGWWWPGNPWTVSYRNEKGEPTEAPVGWLSGACLLVRSEAFRQIGGFDPGYFMYFEDVDLGARLGAAGWQNVYVPTSRVTHTGAHATSRAPSQMATEHHRSAWRYLSRRYRGLRWAPLRVMLHIGLTARAALARRRPKIASGARPNRSKVL